MDGYHYALPLPAVDRVIQAVAVHKVPNSPGLIHGLIDYYGNLIPVINLRSRLNLADKPIRADNYFILVNTPKRKLAIVIDKVGNVILPSAKDLTVGTEMDPAIEASGILRRADGIILIYDIETLISTREEEIIQEFMDQASNGTGQV